MDLLSDLIALGLTEYEAKVYISLVRDYPANGYQLSKRTGVPRSMVYEALARLNARGAVLKSGDQRATLFQPVPPDLLFERYEREHHQLIEGLRDRLQSLYTARKEDLLWGIHGQGAIYAYATKMIANAQREILLVLDDQALNELAQVVDSVCSKDLHVGALLTGAGDLPCKNVAHHPPLESQLQGLNNTLVVVVDGQECLIANTEIEMTATITTNQSFVLLARQFVWMELFAYRLYKQLTPELIARLEDQDRRIFESFHADG